MNKLAEALSRRSRLFHSLNDPVFISQVHTVGQLLQGTVQSGKLVLVCGNGGSAAEASHMVGEIVGRFLIERDGLPAIALNADSVTTTAVANDYGYEQVFARQVVAYRGLAKLLFVLSTSGNSKNLIHAVHAAKSNGIVTVGLLGRDGGSLTSLCDYSIIVPSESTPEIQEVHLVLVHMLCGYVDVTPS